MTDQKLTAYKTVSREMHEAVSGVSVAANRLKTIFSASYTTPASLLLVQKLSMDLELANRRLRKLSRRA